MGKVKLHLKRNTVLEVEYIYKIRELFKKKDWDSSPGYENILSKFYYLFEVLNITQRNFILELTERFLYFSNWDLYQKYFYKLLKSVNKNDYLNCDKIYITSLLTPNTNKKREIKSPDNLLCYARSPVFKSNIDFQGKEFDVRDGIDNLPDIINPNSMVFLVDDFIGTGETAEEALIHFFTYRNLNVSKVKVISLFAMEEGIAKIKTIGAEIFAEKILKKAISDYYDSPEKEYKKDLMINIEKIIKGLEPVFRFGYKNSEALISLGRTPDNTFPIYWKEFTKDSEIIEAPFQRF